jgi:hypothetical protein
MNRNSLKAIAATFVLALAFSAPSAQAAYLCEDDDGEVAICSSRILVPALPTNVPRMPGLGKLPNTDDIEEKIDDLKDKMCDVMPDACD